MSKRRTWRWVTQDYDGAVVKVWEKKKKPNQSVWGTWRQFGDRDTIFSPQSWRSMFDIDVPTDKPIKVEFSGKQLGESSPTSITPKRARRAGNQ